MSASGTVFFSLLIILAVASTFNCTEINLAQADECSSSVNGTAVTAAENGIDKMVPLIDEKKVKVMMMNETRRKLGSFQLCALCTCCSGSRGYCLPSPCCYAINCNIPNRPFGFCSFTPKTCHCFRCHY